ncbi:outer membrane protein assembly factor BamD [Candidatus Blochmannia ocreatus (nom. nud.)]|uniref:Outer membrane protein assembly factor BamD n=1 Tax=Candidatus Blochmannia ocreatus (nom. nud.) TaxID=251538 RepID=A0ABY4SW92_9ENTR|nr:outer membrane protein assembly factor BamD [Candidatus Blochmannia ocreatus]URJ25260.1 outer membrane protein assembly factor BamD [Candidatus Blochmannia ocreatus]
MIIVANVTAAVKPVSNSPYFIYKSAKKKMLNSDYKGAIQDLIILKNLNLFNPCPQQIYLDLIYSYFKINNLKLANNYAENFLQLYLNNEHYDYILYMYGVINMYLDRNRGTLIKYLNIDWFDRDPRYAKIAFSAFAELIRQYPNSQYSFDAHARLIFLKNRIAQYELAVVKFYFKRHAYISVISRVEKMLYNFSDTKATREALPYMLYAYKSIHLLDLADKLEKIMFINSIY